MSRREDAKTALASALTWGWEAASAVEALIEAILDERERARVCPSCLREDVEESDGEP